MSERPAEQIGYGDVDAQAHAAAFVEAMAATARWPAVRHLRAWSRRRLALRPGDRLLDVGCGLADAAVELAADVAPGGEVVGIDPSEVMLAAAAERIQDGVPDGATVRLQTGDACRLDHADASFDAVRGERVLQWVLDETAAVGEMVRVLRPGGRLSLIDTDWHTFTVDVPPEAGGDELVAAMAARRGEAARVGRRLLNHVRAAGLHDPECTGAVHVWDRWDPEAAPGPPGLFPFRFMADELVGAGLLEPGAADRFVAAMEDTGRRDRIFLSVTMFAVSGRT